ncbi:hypothetical protein [Microbacterium elymi]|uniref:Uncharacterized protein n=1 Tax=Microbacterium elymi TaxID=2909587 RepID=A0ABY5NNI4_9MICO|nr:hypothetical protein [Microbacterium elymi]UUT36747.1 hypothetical protein L2X98_32915 [Microbacterium elymi]
MRSASLGVCPVVGSWVMSLTVKMPNCIPGQVLVSLTIGSRFPDAGGHPFLCM